MKKVYYEWIFQLRKVWKWKEWDSQSSEEMRVVEKEEREENEREKAAISIIIFQGRFLNYAKLMSLKNFHWKCVSSKHIFNRVRDQNRRRKELRLRKTYLTQIGSFIWFGCIFNDQGSILKCMNVRVGDDWNIMTWYRCNSWPTTRICCCCITSSFPPDSWMRIPSCLLGERGKERGREKEGERDVWIS